MIFTPLNTKQKDGKFVFSNRVDAVANSCINKDILKEFWFGFTYRTSKLSVSETEQMLFQIGDVPALETEGYMYTIHITEQGVCIAANDSDGLIKGYMTLLDRISAVQLSEENALLSIDCCEIKDKPLIANRMVHFCVFPETELWELQKYIRLCGALKYSHIILEFWGMLQYDCMKELSWSHAYRKDEIRPLIKEANDMGMEVIPMFNHWGHAAGSRVMYGKHVVLDQNPRLQTLFNEDGWSWNVRNEETRQLFRKVREELMELCGEGKYFHLGCDEAYNYPITEESVPSVAEFLREIADELEGKGRRPIIWGDMLIKGDENIPGTEGYVTNCPNKEIERLWMECLDKRLVIADWQYWVKEAPVKSSLLFNENGFDTLLCPWDQGANVTRCCTETVKDYHLYGIMHTTWHTISEQNITYISRCALNCWQNNDAYSDACRTAALLRKVFFADGDYRKSGWHIKELPQK